MHLLLYCIFQNQQFGLKLLLKIIPSTETCTVAAVRNTVTIDAYSLQIDKFLPICQSFFYQENALFSSMCKCLFLKLFLLFNIGVNKSIFVPVLSPVSASNNKAVHIGPFAFNHLFIVVNIASISKIALICRG